ncbi:MAG: hypothetical protein K9H26_18265 [Prolixibacteraceae bacterium]|nr:hypothetical protein [Prolixibacteraceae bacterium]
MRHNVILDLIKSNLDEMMMLAKSFEKPENCSPMLVEILQTKARELQQELDLLKTTLEINVEIEKPVQEIIDPPTVAEIKKEETETEIKEPPKKNEPEKHKEPVKTDTDMKTDIKSSQPLSEEKKPEKKPAEIKPEKENDETKEEETIAETKKEEPPCAPKSEKKIVGERFRKEPSLNERFTEITQKGARVKGKPVTSIKAAIGLNDRFQYIRELFSNNQEKFLTTVNTLDQFSSFIDAIEYLEEHFKWPKNETSLKFMELVKRRFENENGKETTE